MSGYTKYVNHGVSHSSSWRKLPQVTIFCSPWPHCLPAAAAGAGMGIAMTWPGKQGQKPVSLETLIENTERVRWGGAKRKTVRTRDRGAGGTTVNQRCMENGEKREIKWWKREQQAGSQLAAHPGPGVLAALTRSLPSSEEPATPAARAPDQQLWIQNNPSSQLWETQPWVPLRFPGAYVSLSASPVRLPEGTLALPPRVSDPSGSSRRLET